MSDDKRTNWKLFWKTIIYMIGTYLVYKIIYVGLLYLLPGLKNSPWEEVLYFSIVFILSIYLNYKSTRLFAVKINYQLVAVVSILIPVLALALYWSDFFVYAPAVFKQSPFLILIAFLSALGAAFFEETRDRGFGIIGLNKALPNTQWKPLIIAVITSTLFALSHVGNLLLPNGPTVLATVQQVIYTFFFGLVLAIISMKSGTILYGIILHFMLNFSPWSIGSDVVTAMPNYILIEYIFFPLIIAIVYLRPKGKYPLIK